MAQLGGFSRRQSEPTQSKGEISTPGQALDARAEQASAKGSELNPARPTTIVRFGWPPYFEACGDAGDVCGMVKLWLKALREVLVLATIAIIVIAIVIAVVIVASQGEVDLQSLMGDVLPLLVTGTGGTGTIVVVLLLVRKIRDRGKRRPR